MREFVVTGTVTFSGAYCIVEAESAAEAKQKVEGGDVGEGWNIDWADMPDWSVDSVEENS